MTEQETKAAFAAALLKDPSNPFKAAMSVTGATGVNDVDKASDAAFMANYWPKDPFVVSEMQRLQSKEGELAFLPSKADLARKIWELANKPMDAADSAKLLKLYGEVMGHIEKPGTQVNVDARNLSRNVMVVKSHDKDSWEAKARAQQKGLTSDGESSIH